MIRVNVLLTIFHIEIMIEKFDLINLLTILEQLKIILIVLHFENTYNRIKEERDAKL